MKTRIKHLIRRGGKLAKEQLQKPEPTANDVKITNETVAARREEVLGSARKYIYPLQASKHRVVRASIALLVAAIIGFFSFCLLDLYKFQSTSTFIYGVTQVLPLPVAVIDNRYFVSYNDYLFELRHYMHYYETQQHVDFSTKEGKQQLTVFRQRSLDQTMQNAYVERLADANNISVSSQDVDTAVALVRSQNRLGANDQVFQSVLSEFWGWSVDDFRRELRQELLAQKVVDVLDTKTNSRAQQALAVLKRGKDFGKLAEQASDDVATRSRGGDYGTFIAKSNTELAPQIVDALFKLKAGQYSAIINTGYSLEIVKVTAIRGEQVRASHISFNFQPVTAYTDPLADKLKPRLFIHA